MVGAEMEGDKEARAERRRDVGWRVCEAEGWHGGKGSWGPSPASFAPVLPSERKRAGGAPSSLSPGDLSAAIQKTGILLGAPPCSLLIPGKPGLWLSPPQHSPRAAGTLWGLPPCPGVTAGEELLVAQGTIPIFTWIIRKERNVAFFFLVRINKGMESQSSLKSWL